MDSDCEVLVTENEYLSEDETSINEMNQKNETIQEFKTRITDKIDFELVQNVADFILKTNSSLKIENKYLQWRARAIVPRSNDHAIRFILKEFLDFIPRKIQVRKFENDMMMICHLSVRRFPRNLRPINRIKITKKEDVDCWTINLKLRKSFVRFDRRRQRQNLKHSYN